MLLSVSRPCQKPMDLFVILHKNDAAWKKIYHVVNDLKKLALLSSDRFSNRSTHLLHYHIIIAIFSITVCK
jgi:hypothetical protein